MNVYEKLMNVQSQLKAPKSQTNSFGKYKYRSCEDVLEALKPLLAEVKAILTLSDTVEHIGERFYIKASATFTDIEKCESIQVHALAREDENKKGMDLAQVTGSVSSYARKYSLNGLFCIDDTKDADTTTVYDKEVPPTVIDHNKVESIRSLADRKGVRESAVCAAYNITKFEKMDYKSWNEATEKLNLKADKKINDMEVAK